MAADTTLAAPRPRRIIGLVSAGLFFSHFYMLLPPLFPVLREVYGVGFTELGLAITAFSMVTGLTQAPVGLLVDRNPWRSCRSGYARTISPCWA